ncbi:acyl transferase family protein [Methanolobus tindarius DSM 2278]|uniref:Acyl transferase family protein n=1 Tax=Methanolobus tindarius DSM 2278 TaxID=1090322 RepID=W9DP36_METTI|nr:acyltransferase [Methanolobus tindarius]ETA66810.1 acyl transferase family protein [Methanolobus tindarius DSM 2278]
MILKKALLYFWYSLSRCAPTSGLRLFAANKMSYVKLGDDCYLGPNITITPFGGGASYSKQEKGTIFLEIGDRVSISPNVSFFCSMHPENSKLSKIYGKIEKITVENDVWIGGGAILLAGVSLGKNSVIGAGAVVTKDVPENTVVAGVPAKPIKKIPDLED